MKRLFQAKYFEHMTLPKAVLLLFITAIGVIFGTGMYMLAQVLIAPALRDIADPFQFFVVQGLSLIVGILVACGALWLFLGYEDTMQSILAYKQERYSQTSRIVDGRPAQTKEGHEENWIRALAVLIVLSDLSALGNRLLYVSADSRLYVGVFGIVCVFMPLAAGKLYHILGQRPKGHRLAQLSKQVRDKTYADIEATVAAMPVDYRLRIANGEDVEEVYSDYITTYGDDLVTSPKLQALPKSGTAEQSA